jgi:hypothetical protein
VRKAALAGLVLAVLALAACAGGNPAGHEAFRRVMDSQVGKRADDADFYPVYYRLRQADSKTLPNGNVEEEFRAGRNGECRLVFESTPATRQVVAWRIAGSNGECVILPPRD